MRAHLTSCGIAQELQLVPGRALSGGQRSRLAMACVSFLRPHVLVLDGAHDARLMIQERKKKNLSFFYIPQIEEKSLSFAKTGLGNKSALSIMDPCLECLFLNAHQSRPTISTSSRWCVCVHIGVHHPVFHLCCYARSLVLLPFRRSLHSWMDWRAGS